jgi:predicted transcriptional regulator
MNRRSPLPASPIFGSELRTRLLFLIVVLEETYPAELSKHLGTPISSIQRALDSLEREGLIASRQLAVRRLTLNPLYPAAKELRALLLRLTEGYPQYQAIKESTRARPRRRGKRL